MPNLIYLLFAYGITFGIQNKATFLRGKFGLLDDLVKCTYCTGFHTGWMAWIVSRLYERESGWPSVETTVLSVVVWGLTSAAFSYAIDTVVRWCEYRAR